jgi:hypothetical protein
MFRGVGLLFELSNNEKANLGGASDFDGDVRASDPVTLCWIPPIPATYRAVQ